MRNELARRNVVLEKSFAFAVGIVKTGRRLQLEQREWVLSKQLIRSGTSIGANIEEAIAAQSKKDFLSKKYWNNTMLVVWIVTIQHSTLLIPL